MHADWSVSDSAFLDNEVLFVHVRFLVLNYVHTEKQSPQQCHY